MPFLGWWIMKYEIKKILNNNVIWGIDFSNQFETVLVGKGIGFGIKVGDIVEISEKKVDKIFVTYDRKIVKDYMNLVDTLDTSIMEICTEIIMYAESKLGTLSKRIYVVLTDHIAFAIERLKQKMNIINPFLLEIKTLYKDEFDIGLKARDMIIKKIGIDITEDEVGFIALHLNAARENKEVKEKLKHTRLIKSIIIIIEEALGNKIEKDDMIYYRLISHIKASIDRVEKKEGIRNPLLETIKKEFKESYKVAMKIKNEIEKQLDLFVSEDEVGYLAIHIARIRKISEIL